MAIGATKSYGGPDKFPGPMSLVSHVEMFAFKEFAWGDCLGGDSCCNSANPCKEGEGDCDNDSQCAGTLVCGTDNCRRGPLGHIGRFDENDDCCVPPMMMGGPSDK